MSVKTPKAFDELLLDGDLLIFSSCAALEYGNDVEDVSFSKIANNIDARIMNMKRRLGAKKVRVFLSGKDNFRFVIQPDYKANRDGAWRPYNLENAQAYVKTMYDAEWRNGLEADDLVAIHQKDDNSTVIATIDKDIPQVHGWHYRWETQHRGEALFKVTGEGDLRIELRGKQKKKEVKGDGQRFFFWQMLTGDPTDGIMGCGARVTKVFKSGKKAGQKYQSREGLGPIAAYDLLKFAISPAKCLDIVIRQYKKQFGTKWSEQLLMNGRCLYMVNQKIGSQVQLWHWTSVLKTVEDIEEFIKLTGTKACAEKIAAMRDIKMHHSWFGLESQKLESLKMEG